MMKTEIIEKPFSPACERNRLPILEKLKDLLKEGDHIFEIGSGTGQHALYFSDALPQISWTASDHKSNHFGIGQWISESQYGNIYGPESYIATENEIPIKNENVAFTANSLHIMDEDEAVVLFHDLAKSKTIELFLIYGPFKYEGKNTSESNENFDRFLRERDLDSGIRDFEWVQSILSSLDFKLLHDHVMPANNRLLVFKRETLTTK